MAQEFNNVLLEVQSLLCVVCNGRRFIYLHGVADRSKAGVLCNAEYALETLVCSSHCLPGPRQNLKEAVR